jgi:hypothetical protein
MTGHAERGGLDAPLRSVQFGDFTGFEFAQPDEHWHGRQWVLRSDHQNLFVTFFATPSAEARWMPTIEAMLRTLSAS